MNISGIKNGIAILLAGLCLAGALTGCGSPETTVPTDDIISGPVIAADDNRLEINVIENRQDELVFDISIDDYIDAYNALYRSGKIHSAHETAVYTFAEDKSILTIPTITVYAPADKQYISEITVNFDDHGYSEELYDLYDEMCFYTLKVFLPELQDEELISLRDAVNLSAYEDWFQNEDGYRYERVDGHMVCVYRPNVKPLKDPAMQAFMDEKRRIYAEVGAPKHYTMKQVRELAAKQGRQLPEQNDQLMLSRILGGKP